MSQVAGRRLGVLVVTVVALALALANGRGPTSQASAQPPSSQGVSGAEYSRNPDGFLACLSERGVRYSFTEDGESRTLDIVNSNDPATIEANEYCSVATERVSDPQLAQHGNVMTTAIAACLRSEGYIVRVSEPGDLFSGDIPRVVWSVSDEDRSSPAYQDAVDVCTAAALIEWPAP